MRVGHNFGHNFAKSERHTNARCVCVILNDLKPLRAKAGDASTRAVQQHHVTIRVACPWLEEDVTTECYVDYTHCKYADGEAYSAVQLRQFFLHIRARIMLTPAGASHLSQDSWMQTTLLKVYCHTAGFEG